MKKIFKTILLLVFTAIIFIGTKNFFFFTKVYKENYVFLAKWGAEGADLGEFGGKPAEEFILIQESIENLKSKLDNKKLQQLKKLMYKKYMRGDLYKNLLYKLNFEQREVNIILNEASLNKPGVDGGSWWNGPNYIAVDKSGNIYVADIYNDRLQKFDSNGNFIDEWYNRELGCRGFCYAVKVDFEGNIYLFDTEEEYLQKFDSNGNFIKRLDFKNNDFKCINGFPVGLDINSKGYIFIVDSEGDVYVFNPNGNLVKKWSIYNNSFKKMKDDQGNFGRSITIDEKGYIYIDIWETTYRLETVSYPFIGIRSRIIEGFGPGIVKYDSSGNFIKKWKKRNFNDEKVCIPMGHITTNFKGYIFMADKASHCIQVFDSNGNFVTKFGSKGSGDGEFLYPEAVAVDSKGNVYVMDSGNHRIQKFAPNLNFIPNN